MADTLNDNFSVRNEMRRILVFYAVLLIIFGLIFFLAFVSLQKDVNLIGIRGMPAQFEDWVIMVLCVGSIIKVIYELTRIRL